MNHTQPRAPRLPLGLARLGIRGRLTALVVVAALATLAVGATGLLAVRAALDQGWCEIPPPAPTVRRKRGRSGSATDAPGSWSWHSRLAPPGPGAG